MEKEQKGNGHENLPRSFDELSDETKGEMIAFVRHGCIEELKESIKDLGYLNAKEERKMLGAVLAAADERGGQGGQGGGNEKRTRMINVIFGNGRGMQAYEVIIDDNDPHSIIKSLQTNALYKDCLFYYKGTNLSGNSTFENVNCIEAIPTKYEWQNIATSWMPSFGWFWCSRPSCDGSQDISTYEKEFINKYHGEWECKFWGVFLILLLCLPLYSNFIFLPIYNKFYFIVPTIYSIVLCVIIYHSQKSKKEIYYYIMIIVGLLNICVSVATYFFNCFMPLVINSYLTSSIASVVSLGHGEYEFKTSMKQVIGNFAKNNIFGTFLNVLVVTILFMSNIKFADLLILNYLIYLFFGYIMLIIGFVISSLCICSKSKIAEENIQTDIVNHNEYNQKNINENRNDIKNIQNIHDNNAIVNHLNEEKDSNSDSNSTSQINIYQTNIIYQNNVTIERMNADTNVKSNTNTNKRNHVSISRNWNTE